MIQACTFTSIFFHPFYHCTAPRPSLFLSLSSLKNFSRLSISLYHYISWHPYLYLYFSSFFLFSFSTSFLHFPQYSFHLFPKRSGTANSTAFFKAVPKKNKMSLQENATSTQEWNSTCLQASHQAQESSFTAISDFSTLCDELPRYVHGQGLDRSKGSDQVVSRIVLIVLGSQELLYVYSYLVIDQSKVPKLMRNMILARLYRWDTQGVNAMQSASSAKALSRKAAPVFLEQMMEMLEMDPADIVISQKICLSSKAEFFHIG